MVAAFKSEPPAGFVGMGIVLGEQIEYTALDRAFVSVR